MVPPRAPPAARAGLAGALLLAAALRAVPSMLPCFAGPPQPRAGPAARGPPAGPAPPAAALPARGTGAAAPALAAVAAAAALAAAAARGSRARGATARAAAASVGLGAAAAQPATRALFAGAARAGCPLSAARGEEEEEEARDVGVNLLMPKNWKYKKPLKPIVKPFRHCTNWKFRGWAPDTGPVFGKFGLMATEEAWISSRCIETARRNMVRVMERKGKMYIRIFPYAGITKRGAETRFGAGKGALDYWCCPVRPNTMLFEIDGVDYEIAKEAFRKVAANVPCMTEMRVKEGPSLFELGLAGEIKVRGAGRDPRQPPPDK